MAQGSPTNTTPRHDAKPLFVANVVCAWCRMPILRSQPSVPGAEASHGICTPCARRLRGSGAL